MENSTLKGTGIVELPNGNYTYANDFVNDQSDAPTAEQVNAHAQKFGVVGKVLQEHGPQGWPYVEFEGTPNAIRILAADYEQDQRLLRAGL